MHHIASSAAAGAIGSAITAALSGGDPYAVIGGAIGGAATGLAISHVERNRQQTREREERVEVGRRDREGRRGRARELAEHGIPEHLTRPQRTHILAYNPDGTPMLADPIEHPAYGHHGTVPSEWHPVDITGYHPHASEHQRQLLGRTRRHAQIRELLGRTFNDDLGVARVTNPLHR